MPQHLSNGADQRLIAGSRKRNKVDSSGNDMAHAKAEIERLKLELAQAREELESLTEATSDFVKLML